MPARRALPGDNPILEAVYRGDGAVEESLHLQDYWNVLRRRRGLVFAVLALVLGVAAARLAISRPVYEAAAQILIERQLPSVFDFEKNPRATEAWEDFYQTQYRLLQSRLLARKVVERLHLLQDPEFGGPRDDAAVRAAETAPPGMSAEMERTIDRFLGRLRIQPVKNSQLVAIAFRSSRPDLSTQAVNTLTELYIQQTLDFRYRVSAEAGAWLDEETKDQAEKVRAAEVAIQKFTEREGLANIEERRTLLEQKLKDLGAAVTVAKTRRLDKEALYREMRSTGNAEELPQAIESPLIQGLRSELASLERQAAQLAARGFLDQHPEVAKVRQQIEGTRHKIAFEARRVVRAAENDYRVAAAQEASAAAALEAAKNEAQDLSRRGLEYDALKRDLEASKQVSASILTRQKQTDVSRDVQVSNIHVIDPATVPEKPVSPRPVRDLGLALVLGLGGGIALAFLRDYLDTSVGKPADVRRLGVPLLGVIPETTAGKSLLLAANGQRKEAFAEGYRVLRTALQAPAEDGRGQVLLLTSTLPGEGKSLTSVNLALALASADSRVLLIDADLRRPVLSTLLGTRRTPGLSEVLTGVAKPEQAIQRVPGTRLSLLPSGTPVRRNPADLLATTALRDLLTSLRSRYDHIVLDTPPGGAIADALILSPLADGVLVVARSGKVTRSALVHVLERLVNARAFVLGVVLNRARPDLDRYDYGPAFTPEAFVSDARLRLPSGSGGRDPHSSRRVH
jgi:capsular exopolysaccharide synthesis family protein